MEDEDRLLFERTLAKATAEHTGAALDAALDEVGWSDALSIDPHTAVSVLFELQGAANATSSALGQVFAHALGVKLSAGTVFVLPSIGRWDPPGTVEGNQLEVHGLGSGSPSEPEPLVVVTSIGAGTLVVTPPASSLALRLVEGMDPDLSLLEVTGRCGISDLAPEVPAGEWTAAVALGRLAVAHQLVGASRTMLDLACEHARSRIQFGRPIGSFQAIRHRLAETRVGIDMADALLDSAWLDRSPVTAAMAKAVAGRQARTTARHCQQVLAGIGFTTEHPLHRFVRRTLVLDALLGSASTLTRVLGTEVIDTSRLPALPAL
jgi:hypothetical protein